MEGKVQIFGAGGGIVIPFPLENSSRESDTLQRNGKDLFLHDHPIVG
jgi:hypothetical protein